MGALSGRRRIPLPLRVRGALAFGIGALVLSTVLSVLTFVLCRSYLLEQRQDAATDRAFVNARLVRGLLRSDDVDVAKVMTAADRQDDSSIVLSYRGDWFASAVNVGEEDLPASLRDAVASGQAGVQRFTIGGVPELAVGVPIAESKAGFFQVFQTTELRHTLSALQTSLIIAAALTTVGGAAVGYWASKRVLRPVRQIATAAVDIAGGELDKRLESRHDPDLDPLTESFNAMVDALKQRIEREARFASDVSHELRTPLAALSAGMEVIERQRDALPERAGVAVDVITDQVDAFERLVLDLLEVSRIDAGVANLELREVDIERFVHQVIDASGFGPVDVTIEDPVDRQVNVDVRRLRQAISNLLENAERYAGGATDVRVWQDDGHLDIAVEDRGPGVAPAERTEVFERFSRGAEGRRKTNSRGSGLGLSLVNEHARLHGGKVWVEDRPGGGARFVIELPRTPSQ